MFSFDNTEIAFKSKSNKDLNRAYVLFQAIRNPGLVKIANALLGLALKIHFPVNWVVKPTVYSHFVGGETIDKSKKAVHDLGNYQVKGILDYSVQGSEKDEDIEAALKETLRTIDNAAQDANVPFAVFKPTAFAKEQVLIKRSAGQSLTPEEEEEDNKFLARVDTLCQKAYEKKVPILIDAEDYAFQKHIDTVVTAMQEKYNKESAVVFNTLQMYRHDRLAFLKESIEKARQGGYCYGVKFVRGAYMEKERERARQMGYPSPIYADKEGTDDAYNEALKIAMENIDMTSIFNGTHNEYSSRYLTELMTKQGLEKNDPRIWFSQLYGMSDHISFNLAQAGYNVAKYVPYGPVRHVMPYLFRRAEENTSVKGQTNRELSLLIQEKKRRKKAK